MDIIERIEAAKAGTRDLDALVTVALRVGCTPNLPDDLHYLTATRPDDECVHGTYWFHQRSGKSLRTAMPITMSAKAAMDLAEQLLPGWSYGINGEFGGGATVTFEQPSVDQGGVVMSAALAGLPEFEADGATPALAICAALLKAKAAR